MLVKGAPGCTTDKDSSHICRSCIQWQSSAGHVAPRPISAKNARWSSDIVFSNVVKNWKSAQVYLSSTSKFYRTCLLFFRNHIQRGIDPWLQRPDLATKWNVTVPNSITLIKPIVCRYVKVTWLTLSNDTWITHISNSHPHFRKTGVWNNFFYNTSQPHTHTYTHTHTRAHKHTHTQFLVQQKLNVSYKTNILWSIFMSHKHWLEQLSRRNGIRYKSQPNPSPNHNRIVLGVGVEPDMLFGLYWGYATRERKFLELNFCIAKDLILGRYPSVYFQ